MFYVYILFSQNCNKYYVGYSTNPLLRLETRHNKGKVTATKNCKLYSLLAQKAFSSEQEAMAAERHIKKMKSRNYIKKLVVEWQTRPD
ncbi:MAG: GIY-YIG nuclease family protein [Sphingobacteriales bacterium]|nr:MAG: GIY-YIG nuclease family protein [Sphingobacteriales bacterium]